MKKSFFSGLLALVTLSACHDSKKVIVVSTTQFQIIQFADKLDALTERKNDAYSPGIFSSRMSGTEQLVELDDISKAEKLTWKQLADFVASTKATNDPTELKRLPTLLKEQQEAEKDTTDAFPSPQYIATARARGYLRNLKAAWYQQ